MGRDYEYHLYFPREQMWNVLQSLAAIAMTDSGETTIVLPDCEIVLPFTSGFENKTIVFNETLTRMSFDTSLYFDSDAVIEEHLETLYSQEDREFLRDSKGRVGIGFIYLSVEPNLKNVGCGKWKWKPNICRFEFTAATTAMSLLFENSPSIRQTFTHLLEANQGLCGYFHDSDYHYFETYAFWPKGMSVKETEPRFLVEPDSNCSL
jgi:hypothetical protein